MQLPLIFWMLLNLSSKFLPFLSLQIVHQIQCRIILHHFFCVLLPPLLIQQLNKYVVCSGIDHFVSVKLRNIVQSWDVTLQWRNTWLFVSLVSLHNMHLDTIGNPFFCRISWVRQAFLITNQAKHLTLVGAILSHTCFQGPILFRHPRYLFPINSTNGELAILSCFHLKVSSSTVVPLKPSIICNSSQYQQMHFQAWPCPISHHIIIAFRSKGTLETWVPTKE